MTIEQTVVALFSTFGWQEIVLILLVILLLFGGRKLPELARGLGKALRDFKKELRGAGEDKDKPTDANQASPNASGDEQQVAEKEPPKDGPKS